MTDIDILLCYRGRFKKQVERLDELLTKQGYHVTFDAEILQPGIEYGEAEIEWMSLGSDEQNGDTSWRGPLQAAVQRSKLIVFLFDTQDPSVNVFNEIGWTAHSKKALFLVFNTTGEDHSEDWEGMQLGMIQAMYGLIGRDPEIPNFGYHFVTHKTDKGLDNRLTILANRIISYFNKVEHDEVAKLRIDTGTTLKEVENLPIMHARRRLYSIQERIATAVKVKGPLIKGDPLQYVLSLAHEREQDGQSGNGRIYPKNSPFSYPEQSERERYRRTERLIERIRPGKFEFPNYIEMLIRELVSIQMVLDTRLERELIIGTVFQIPADVPGDIIIEPDYAVLLVDASFLDYAYQMLKATVMSWKITSRPGVLPVSMSSKVEDTREVIMSNPDLVAGFARSLRELLSTGIPGSSTKGIPPAAYHPAITMLGVFQKRFTVGVALARMVARDILKTKAAEKGSHLPKISSEEWIIATDLLAARWVFDSANKLDNVDPTVAFQGISLQLASYDLMEQLMVGYRPPEIVPSSTRIHNLDSFFRDYLVAHQFPLQVVDERQANVRNILASFDLLRLAAIESGDLDPQTIQISPRWRRHIH